MDSNFRFWYVFFGRNSKRRNIQRRAMPHFPLTTAGDFCQSNFRGFTHTQHEKFRFLDSSSAIKMLDILFSKETVVLCRWESEIWKFGFAPCKVIQESLRFRIPRCRFRIPWLWIPDSISMDFVFHNQQPGFWITIMAGFRIPLAGFRIPKPWIPDSTRIPQTKITWIPDSGLPYVGRFGFTKRIEKGRITTAKDLES